ncbi:MAG: hypothetical protein KDK27_10825, partial [Leptospiraceae bacterium]|nr:hypothetical protein [Leptospiraceae bacterium]
MKLRISTRIVSLFSIILLAACTQIIRDSRQADYTTTGADDAPQYERSEDYEEYMEEASGVSDGQSTNRDRRNIQDASVAQDESESKAAVDGHQSEGDTSIEPAEHLRSEESPAVRAPELLARVGDQNRKPLPLRSHDIAIVVAGHRVRVVQDLVFENIHANSLSGELMLELPDGATPCY